ncbi:hypothetical protein [Streptomyces sp. NPDC087294]|uniref:hypothetical protein n=1 Tax=Streptomyces sp. NPDC087294 TaxID=3365777 RepID=UPI003819F009
MTGADDIPPMPPAPPATGDWWDRLYAEAEVQTPAPVTVKTVPAQSQSSRLGDWREGRDVLEPETDDGQDDGDGDDQEHELADAEVGPKESADAEEPEGRWLRPAPGYYPSLPKREQTEESERKIALSPGTRRLLANTAAAGAGYLFGLVPLVGGWIADCGRETSISGALVLGGGICLVVAHVWDRRTRHWLPALAWVARIPLASAITALALYAPAAHI